MSEDFDIEKEVQNMDAEELEQIFELVEKLEKRLTHNPKRLKKAINFANKIAPGKKRRAAFKLAEKIVTGEE